jgi:hypothetical protein
LGIHKPGPGGVDGSVTSCESVSMRFLVFASLILLHPLAWSQSAGVDIKTPPKVKVIAPKSAQKPAAIIDATSDELEDDDDPDAEVEAATKRHRPKKHHKRLQNKSPVEWGGAIAYVGRTDLADQARPRLYVHTLDFSYGFSHRPTQISAALAVGVAYESVGDRNSEILVNSNNAELFVNDVDLSVDKTFNLNRSWKFSLYLDNEFPTSPDARREGYNSITSPGLGIATAVFDRRLVMDFKSIFTYIWNSYTYSPASEDLNKRSGWRNTLGLKFRVWRGLFIGATAGQQISTYMDNSSDGTYRNSVSMGYAWDQFIVSLGYSNGTYLNQEDATIWFLDQYRQTASLHMIFQF